MPGQRSARMGIIALGLVVGGSLGAVASSPAPGTGALPSFPPDEPLVLVAHLTDAGGGIFVRPIDGTVGQQLATDLPPGVHKAPDWSPDGRHVVFIDGATERMWIAHLDGSPTEAVAACDTPGCDYPAWSPDGTRIAFSRYENADGVIGPAALGIYTVDLASGEVSPVVRLERPLLTDRPRWSPDGTQIVFGVDRMDEEAFDTGAAIAVVPVIGGEPRYLTSFDEWAYGPDWSWVTDEIVYGNSIRDTMRDYDPDAVASDIFVIRPDGSAKRQVTHASTGEHFRGAHWTPDGAALTAYHIPTYTSILVDPATGAFEPLITLENEVRPVLRPVP